MEFLERGEPHWPVRANIRWEITVSPDSDGDVTVTLPATEDCEAQGATCTEDGRMLSEGLELMVEGAGQKRATRRSGPA